MSDLSSNSMSRDELIRSARANCMRHIDTPQAVIKGEEKIVTANTMAFRRGTYIRLFFSCLILLGALAVKQFELTYQGYGYGTIVSLLEENNYFERLQIETSKTLEKDVIPAFQQILDSDKKK